MNETEKKISLLSELYSIIDNNCVNTTVSEYEFSSIHMLIINQVEYDINGYTLNIVLFLDELIVEIKDEGRSVFTFSLPYDFVDNFYIIGDDERVS